MLRVALNKGESFAVHEDRIIVSVDDKQKVTKSGILIPGNPDEKSQVGTVEGIGNDKSIYVKKGDRVVFNKYAGNELVINDQEFMIMRMADVMGTIEKGGASDENI
jgi:chaperonin GroES